jgi:hypothetical protein
LKSPIKTGKESPGRAMGLATGKTGWELCPLADPLQLKITVRAMTRQLVRKAFLTKAKVFIRIDPDCDTS